MKKRRTILAIIDLLWAQVETVLKWCKTVTIPSGLPDILEVLGLTVKVQHGREIIMKIKGRIYVY